MHCARALVGWISALALLVTGARGQDVLVVDAGGGGDHLSIQAAVDAAADGDVVLVRQGGYTSFRIHGKGLSVVADRGALVSVSGGVRVENTLLDQHVFLSGLTCTGNYTVVGGTEHGLLAILVRGTFRVQDCSFQAGDGMGYTDVNDHGGDGAFLQHVFDGAFNGCQFQGGEGGESFDSACFLQRAGNGLWVQDSSASFQGCEARAGDAQEFDLSTCDYGGQQGHGLRLVDSDLYLAGTDLYGGRGGTEGLCSVIWPGGDGLHAQGASVAQVLDCSLNGGPSNVCGAPMGQSSVALGGASIGFLSGSLRVLGLPSPSRALEAETLTISGQPGDYAWLLLSFNPGRRDLVQAFSGPLLVGTPLAAPRRDLGVLPATGPLLVPIVAPPPAMGNLARELHLQVFVRDLAGGLWLGGARRWVILDPSL